MVPGGGGAGGPCALFFTNVTRGANWEPVHVRSQGTCAECVEAMVEQARGVDVAGLGAVGACEKVRGEFSGEGG